MSNLTKRKIICSSLTGILLLAGVSASSVAVEDHLVKKQNRSQLGETCLYRENLVKK